MNRSALLVFTTLLTALAPLIWGSTYIVTSQILPPDRPFIAAVLRCLPAGLLILLYVRCWPGRQHWLRLVVIAVLNIGLFQAMLFTAAYRLPGGLAAVVGAIQPLVVMMLNWVVNRRQPVMMAGLAAVAGVLGMALMLLSPQSHWDTLGMLAALAGAGSMALGTWLTHRWQLPLPVMALTGWQLTLGGLMLVPVALLSDPALPALTGLQVVGYLYLCLAGAVLAYSLWFRGIKQLPGEAVASLGLLSPVCAVALGWGVLDQRMQGTTLVGLIVVLVSVLLVQRYAGRVAINNQKRD